MFSCAENGASWLEECDRFVCCLLFSFPFLGEGRCTMKATFTVWLCKSFGWSTRDHGTYCPSPNCFATTNVDTSKQPICRDLPPSMYALSFVRICRLSLETPLDDTQRQAANQATIQITWSNFQLSPSRTAHESKYCARLYMCLSAATPVLFHKSST